MTQNKKQIKIINGAITIIGCLMVLYHMVSTQYLFQGYIEHQIFHLGFALTLVYLSTLKTIVSRGGKLWPVILLLLATSITVAVYMKLRYEHLEMTVGFPDTYDLIIGIALLVVVLEATRESWGAILPIIALIFAAYYFFGQYSPAIIRHPGYLPEYVVSALGIGFQGTFGRLLAISANYIFLYVLFGSVLQTMGALGFIVEVGKAAGKILVGGPAQTAVIGSSLVGTVTGAAVANVYLTGSFTIPLMKSVGYHRDMAGAVEATASTGGQLMPPVMGAAAFIMADFVGVPYIVICLGAIIPSLLYYFSVGMGVEVFARREKIVSTNEPVNLRVLVRRAIVFLGPLTVIIVLLLSRFSAMYAAFWAIIVTVGLAYIQKETRPSLSTLIKGLTEGAVQGAKIGVAISCIGIMAQTLIDTVLGVRFTALVEVLSGGSVILALFFTMVVSIILGCGVPTSGAYLLVALVVAPALVRLGVPLLAAHFFAFYFAIISSITPPVAIAALAGASIAGGNYWKTGLNATKLAIAAFVTPYFFAFNPVFLLQPGQPSLMGGITTVIGAFLATSALVAVIYNHFIMPITPWERAAYALCVALMFAFIFTTGIYLLFILSVLLFAALMVLQWRTRKSLAMVKAAPSVA